MAFFLTLATVNGCATVISKMINYQCTRHLGRDNGSLVNYVVASVLSFFLLLVSSRFQIDFYRFQAAPWYLYLGGVFGIIAFVLSMVTLTRLKVMESTILLLVGQLTASVIFDSILFQNISIRKLAGILLVAIGVIWDSKVSNAPGEAQVTSSSESSRPK